MLHLYYRHFTFTMFRHRYFPFTMFMTWHFTFTMFMTWHFPFIMFMTWHFTLLSLDIDALPIFIYCTYSLEIKHFHICKKRTSEGTQIYRKCLCCSVCKRMKTDDVCCCGDLLWRKITAQVYICIAIICTTAHKNEGWNWTLCNHWLITPLIKFSLSLEGDKMSMLSC